MSADPALAALAVAVQANDTDAVARALADHPGLSSRLDEAMPGGAFGATPLLHAVYHGNRKMIDVLLRAGANINARSHWWAGGFGVLDHDGDLTDFLLDRGARLDVHAASRLGNLNRLQALIPPDPELVHARGGDGQTPLHFASSVAVVEYLLAHGADIDALDVDHESTPAQWMVRDRQEVARYLVSRGCRTDILMAAALGDGDRVKRHLDADPSSIRTTVSEEFFPKRDPRSGGTVYIWTLGGGKSAHVIAKEFGHHDVLRLLMERTPAPTQLTVACEIGDADAVTALLAANPDLPKTLTASEHRRLPDAARDNNLEAVRLMLAAGFPIGARGQHGATALHWAGFRGDAAMARELLRHHPPLEVTDEDFNGTPLFWAVYGSVHGPHCRSGSFPRTVEILLDAGATPPSGDVDASDAVRDVLTPRKR